MVQFEILVSVARRLEVFFFFSHCFSYLTRSFIPRQFADLPTLSNRAFTMLASARTSSRQH